jgi:hypothetical protein
MRARLMAKYPEYFPSSNIGNMPANAVYHAETNVLLRAARANGGSLAGRILEVYGDTRVCNNCGSVLPFVGLELGNPTVTFVNPGGRRQTMTNGAWINEAQP